MKLELSCTSELTALAKLRLSRRHEESSPLKELSVTNSHVTKHFVQKVFRGKHWPNLERLYLQNNDLSNEGVEMLAKCIGKGFLPKLHTLNVANNQCGDIGAIALTDTIQNTKHSLRNLYLYNNCIGDLGAEALSQCCVNDNPTRTLQELFLWGNNITDVGRHNLCRARYDGLLLWIDLAPKATSKKQEKGLASVKEKKSTRFQKQADTLQEFGHRSLQRIHETPTKQPKAPIKASHYWTPRRAPQKLNRTALETRFSSPSTGDPSKPKPSKNTIMVPVTPVSASARKKISPSKEATVFARPTPSFETTSPGRTQQATPEPSLNFQDLLNKAKAMESPSTKKQQTLRKDAKPSVSPPFRTKESPQSSVFKRDRCIPLTKEPRFKSPKTPGVRTPLKPSSLWKPKSSAMPQVSPTSPMGEYIETTRLIQTTTCPPLTNESERKSDFQTLLNKARALEGRAMTNPSTTAPKQNLQVPYFMPDLEQTPQSKGSSPRSNKRSSSTWQIKNRFEGKALSQV